jgi:hypothetical protein
MIVNVFNNHDRLNFMYIAGPVAPVALAVPATPVYQMHGYG